MQTHLQLRLDFLTPLYPCGTETFTCHYWQELWSLLEFMMPDVFDTSGVDLDQYLGTRNSTTGVVVQDKDLITRIKAILGPFVLRRLKSDVMRQLVPKIQQVCLFLQLIVFLLCYNCY